MVRSETRWGPWDPAPMSDVVGWFSKTGAPWWMAGGYAIELAVGRSFRDHHDIDVLMLRRDQLAVQEVLPGWEWWCSDPSPGNHRPWLPGELLPVGVHDIWCRPGPEEPYRVQVMLDEANGDTWTSRRNTAVRRPLADIGRTSPDGIPYLVPEVQLFYKAKTPRPKDETDFDQTLPTLTGRQREWLADAITHAYGPHPWTSRLQGGEDTP